MPLLETGGVQLNFMEFNIIPIGEMGAGIFMVFYFVATLLAVYIGNYAFHASTKGNHFREWKEFEPLDTPIPNAATSKNYDANIALIQGRLQNLFRDLYAQYSPHMCGDKFVEYVAAEYYDNEKSTHRVLSLTEIIMKITPKSDRYYKLLESTKRAIELMPKP